MKNQNIRKFCLFRKQRFLGGMIIKNQMSYRHELKYEIDNYQLEILKMRLASFLESDKHTGTTGSYTVRSVYYDDINNRCFYDNENGNDNRKKFRIRTYNCSDSRINLELKHKKRGMTLKESCIIDKQIAECLINDTEKEWSEEDDPILKKMVVLRKTIALSPKVIVEYDRTPFVYRDGNVRITLDQNIRFSNDTVSFFEKRLPFRPVMPFGRHVLEVKYDQFLPDFISKNISSLGLQQITFSKYYYSRKMGGIL